MRLAAEGLLLQHCNLGCETESVALQFLPETPSLHMANRSSHSILELQPASSVSSLSEVALALAGKSMTQASDKGFSIWKKFALSWVWQSRLGKWAGKSAGSLVGKEKSTNNPGFNDYLTAKLWFHKTNHS